MTVLLAACTAGGGSDGPTRATTGPSNGAGGGDARSRGVAATVDLVTAAAQEQAVTTASLAEAIEGLCATPSPVTLESARQAWREAVIVRAAVRVHAVASLGDRTSMARMDWPRDDEAITALLDSGQPVTRAMLEGGAAGRRGLFALEVVLFGPGADALAEGREARCSYAAAAAQLLAEEALRLVAAVAEDALSLTGQAGVSASTAGAIDQLVNQHATAADDLADMWLPAGSANVTLRGPGRIAGPWTSAMARALAAVYAEDALGGSLAPDLRQRISDATDALASAATALGSEAPGSGTLDSEALDSRALDDLPAADRDDLVARADAVRVLVRTEVVSALDVILTFSDNDGDSG